MESGGFPIAWIQWLIALGNIVNNTQDTGTTAQRPNPAPYVGFYFYDTTLSKPIYAKTVSPATWADALNNPV